MNSQPHSADPLESRRPPSKRKAIFTAVLGLIVMVAVFAFLFPQIANYGQAFEQLERLNWWWVLALIAASVLNIVVYPLTVRAALPFVRYAHAFIQRQVGFLISNILPGGGAFAIGTQYSILGRYGVDRGSAAAAVTADAVWTYLLTLGTPALAVMLLVFEGRSTAGYLAIAVFGAIVVLVSVIALTMALRSETGAERIGRLLQRPATWLFSLVRKKAPDVVAMLTNFYGHAHEMVITRWRQLTVTNIAAQLTPFVVLLVALWALGAFPGNVSFIEVFAAYAIAILLVSFPITPGGLGTVDAALVGLLVAFGVDNATAVAADLVWRLVWFLPQLLVGLGSLGWFSLQRRRGTHAESSGA